MESESDLSDHEGSPPQKRRHCTYSHGSSIHSPAIFLSESEDSYEIDDASSKSVTGLLK